jgi:hypothetical protein
MAAEPDELCQTENRLPELVVLGGVPMIRSDGPQ